MTRPYQGLSSLAPGVKMRDPGNEVAHGRPKFIKNIVLKKNYKNSAFEVLPGNKIHNYCPQLGFALQPK